MPPCCYSFGYPTNRNGIGGKSEQVYTLTLSIKVRCPQHASCNRCEARRFLEQSFLQRIHS